MKPIRLLGDRDRAVYKADHGKYNHFLLILSFITLEIHLLYDPDFSGCPVWIENKST